MMLAAGLDVEQRSLPALLSRSQAECMSQENGREARPERKRLALVVDDSEDVTLLLAVLLEQAGYSVVMAYSASAALRSARSHDFDLVVSDIGMPGMNGYDLARALRRAHAYKNVPMVAVTGYAMFVDRQLSVTAGFSSHLNKPIDPESFIALIESLSS